ncbi:thiazole biosynthesis protein [Thermosulfuriphilus ammonigenes]|uniref:Thiamine thiazole synthase n=1 Tax=Thermosulfuriphilus ammonigenes TaxID=1936021 RepID=A0A6G7PTV1_9BACT|nr:sulfide-dependent adenosine diphosphate thiazole synthase [Thermosulfuriphilus ammonigenes]MBA2848826.1 thiamine thiazole synthase [Thermosulfuriphilus ammonigenes]QIJ71050.1 thiazole biosynthesis protein [Thermosulfuriphilus ammonigenes]
MSLDEIKISRAILDRYFQKLSDCLDLDVAVVGGGPSGLMAALKLAEAGYKVAVFERKLSIGGGMWGGGMMFNEIVVQEEGARILKELGVPAEPYDDGYYTADAVCCMTTLTSKACLAGVKVFNLISVEDVMVRENRVTGLVINWTAVEMASLHVDPLAVRAKYVVEATGHDCEVLRVIERKLGGGLFTETGKIIGEKSLWAEMAETTTLENTKEAFPGVFVTGMAANATFGSFRMGPIFGGMLLSGEKVASLIEERLKQGK